MAGRSAGYCSTDRPKPRRRAIRRSPLVTWRSVPIATQTAGAPPPRRHPLPGAAEARNPRVQRLLRRYARFGDLGARDELVERFFPLAPGLPPPPPRAPPRRYRRGAEPLDDLVQVASIGLLRSIERFDPERGREFTTYAIPTIVGELKRYYRDYAWAMKVPRGDKERVLTLTRAIEELSARHGRAPTPQELADHSGMCLEDVLAGLALAAAALPASLEDSACPHDGEPCTLGESIGGEDATLALVECRDVVSRSVSALTAREHRVLYLRFVEDLTQREIGEHIGVSQMQVSRILRMALERSRAGGGAPA